MRHFPYLGEAALSKPLALEQPRREKGHEPEDGHHRVQPRRLVRRALGLGQEPLGHHLRDVRGEGGGGGWDGGKKEGRKDLDERRERIGNQASKRAKK